MKSLFEKFIEQQNSPTYPLQQRINELKAKLRATNDTAIMFAEGELSAEEYEPVKLERRAWRAEINQLEAEIEDIKKSVNK